MLCSLKSFNEGHIISHNCVLGAIEPVFLLYGNSRLGEIRGVSCNLGTTNDVIPPISGLARPVAVDFHVKDEFIYYSDAVNFTVGRQRLNGTDKNTSFIVQCKYLSIKYDLPDAMTTENIKLAK